MISKEALDKLRYELPVGSAKMIRDRIYRKTGRLFSINYINNCLDSDNIRFNQLILEEAIILRDELNHHKSELEQRILNPSSF